MHPKLLKNALDDRQMFSDLHNFFPKELIASALVQLVESDRYTYYQLLLDVQGETAFREYAKSLDKEERLICRNILLDLKGDRIADDHPRIIGDRVYVSKGKFRTAGEGVVVDDRGWGWARMLEVKMTDTDGNTFNQVVCAADARLLVFLLSAKKKKQPVLR